MVRVVEAAAGVEGDGRALLEDDVGRFHGGADDDRGGLVHPLDDGVVHCAEAELEGIAEAPPLGRGADGLDVLGAVGEGERVLARG